MDDPLKRHSINARTFASLDSVQRAQKELMAARVNAPTWRLRELHEALRIDRQVAAARSAMEQLSSTLSLRRQLGEGMTRHLSEIRPLVEQHSIAELLGSRLAVGRDVIERLGTVEGLIRRQTDAIALAGQLSSSIAEARRLPESSTLPISNAQLAMSLAGAAGLRVSALGSPFAGPAMAAAMAQVEYDLEEALADGVDGDGALALGNFLENLVVTARTSVLDRLSFEFYLNILFSVLFMLIPLQLSADSEQRIISAVEAAQEELQKQLERHEAARVDTSIYYVARRPTFLVRSPKPKSAATGILYPNQITRLVMRKGKWIQVEYFDYLEGVHRSGWCLKKYLQRLPSSAPGPGR